MSLHKKIHGFTPPSGTPRDFSIQVQNVVSKYNKLIDDCTSYQSALKEAQNNYRVLWDKYNELKTTSEKLAEKYEHYIEQDISALA